MLLMNDVLQNLIVIGCAVYIVWRLLQICRRLMR